MRKPTTLIPSLFGAMILALCAGSACAGTVTVGDLARIRGMEANPLVGMGLIVGLDGTGDTSKKSKAAIRPFAEFLRSLGNPVPNLEELVDGNAIAIVAVTMEVDRFGGSVGDRFDVHVDKLFNAKSLEGGRLMTCLLRLPGRDDPNAPIYARASGPLQIHPDNPAAAVIRKGGQIERDLRNQPVVNGAGYMWLSVHSRYAGWLTAARIVQAINEPEVIEPGFGDDAYPELARAMDAKTVRIRVPDADRSSPGDFIAWLTSVTIDTSLLDLPARIVVDRRAGLLVVTHDVELDPVAFAHDGLRIATLEGGGNGSAWGVLETEAGETSRTARLSDLVEALQLMNVPVKVQIAIVEGLEKSGALHAEILYQ